MELLGQNEVDHRQRKLVILSQDRFYKVLTADQKAKALKGQYNFDHPGRSRDPVVGGGEGTPRRVGRGLHRDAETSEWFHGMAQVARGGGQVDFAELSGSGDHAGAAGSLGWSQSRSLPL